MKRGHRVVVLLASVGVLVMATTHMVSGEHVDFRFKWPWRPLETTTVAVTGWPYQAHHCCGETCNNGGPGSCTDAYDFDITDGGDWVISSAEGTVLARRTTINPEYCISADGLGNYVKVLVPTPTELDPGDTIQVWYGHLTSVSPPGVGATILQGDPVGVQGITGHTYGNDWGWDGTSWGNHCGKHLHLEFWPSSEADPQHPEKMDGQTSPGTSTNSGIGEYWYYGFPPDPIAIRTKYIQMGGWDGIDPSYSATIDDMGWTNDPQRQGLPSPQALYVHTYRAWGFEQDFRQPADPWGKEREGIYQPDWSPGSGFIVRSPFWDAWEAGGAGTSIPPVYHSISVPLADQGGCPPGSRPDCVAYQLTHLGYLWMHAWGWYAAVWCPDVGMGAGNKTKNGVADIQDVLAVLWYAFTYQGGPPNSNGVSYDPWYDAGGDTGIDMSDVLAVLDGVMRDCYPT